MGKIELLTNVDIQAAGRVYLPGLLSFLEIAASRGCQVGGKHTLPPPRPPTMGAAQAVKAATKGSAPEGSKSLDSPVL